MAITNFIEPRGFHLIRSVMVVLIVKSNKGILNMDDLGLALYVRDIFDAIYSLKTTAEDRGTELRHCNTALFLF